MGTRLKGWESLLVGYIEANNATPRKWGSFDCAFAAGESTFIITGVDPLKEYRGYKTGKGAIKKLKKIDGTLSAAMIRKFGESINPKMAGRGDVCLQRLATPIDGFDERLGICLGAHAVFAGLVGWDRVPMSVISMAWKV